MLNQSNQKGFSLIELILVVVIVGLLATIAVPSFMRARDAAEKASAVSLLRTLHTAEARFKFHNGRYGQLDEINKEASNSLGKMEKDVLTRGNYKYYLSPTTKAALENNFSILAVKYDGKNAVKALYLTEDGIIRIFI